MKRPTKAGSFSEWPTLLYAAYLDNFTSLTYMLLKPQLESLLHIYKIMFRKNSLRSFAVLKPLCTRNLLKEINKVIN